VGKRARGCFCGRGRNEDWVCELEGKLTLDHGTANKRESDGDTARTGESYLAFLDLVPALDKVLDNIQNHRAHKGHMHLRP
jgi:hypothetical protein